MKPEKFIDRIKGTRITERLTQVEFAKQIGVTVTSVVNWEAGNYFPGFEVLVTIANRYRINLNWLLLGIEKMHREPEFEYQIPDHVKMGYSKYPDVKEATERHLKIKDSVGEGYKVDVNYTVKKIDNGDKK